jgi:hypothetical protein
MSDERLLHLLEHPPRDPERRSDPAFTAAVMQRICAPTPSTPTSVRAVVALATVLVLVVGLLPSFDPLGALVAAAPGLDADLGFELLPVALVAAVVLALGRARAKVAP